MMAEVLLGCDRGQSQDQAVSNDAQASEVSELRQALATTAKKAKEMEARALAAEAALEKVRHAQAKAPPESIPNERRPVGDRMIQVWDKSFSLWRNVRIKDIDWQMVEGRVGFGLSKDTPKILLVIKDQLAEAWVSEYMTGKKVEIPGR